MNCFVRFQNEALPASQIVRWLNAKGLLEEAKGSRGKVSPGVAADPVFRAAYADTLTDALYAGIIRATTGDREDAKRLLDIASGSDLLPEEQRLLSQNHPKVE